MNKWDLKLSESVFQKILTLLKSNASATQIYLRYELTTYQLVYIVDSSTLYKMPKKADNVLKNDKLIPLAYADKSHVLVKLECSVSEFQNYHLELQHNIDKKHLEKDIKAKEKEIKSIHKEKYNKVRK